MNRKAAMLRCAVMGLLIAAASAFQLPFSTNPSHPTAATTPKSPWLAAAPIAFAALVCSFSPDPSGAFEGDVFKGSEVFASTCVGCHRGGQNFVKEQKTLQKEALEKFVGLDEEKVYAFFRGSFVHKVGPVGQLNDDEAKDVITFVVDQARNDKW